MSTEEILPPQVAGTERAEHWWEEQQWFKDIKKKIADEGVSAETIELAKQLNTTAQDLELYEWLISFTLAYLLVKNFGGILALTNTFISKLDFMGLAKMFLGVL